MTIQIQLSQAYDIAGVNRSTVEFKEPTVDQMTQSIKFAAQHTDPDLKQWDKERFLIASCIECAPDELGKLTTVDFSTLQLALVHSVTPCSDRQGVIELLGKSLITA